MCLHALGPGNAKPAVYITFCFFLMQHNLTVGRAVANAEDAQSRSGLFQQLQSITDLLLEGYIAQLESSMQADGEDSVQYAELEQRYTQERTTLISPFCK